MKYEGYDITTPDQDTSSAYYNRLARQKPILEERMLIIEHYGFFLVADYLRLCGRGNPWYVELKEITRTHRPFKGTINHDRIRAYTRKSSRKEESFVRLNKWIKLNGYVYRVCLSCHDNLALLGKCLYKTLCANTGIQIDKDIIVNEEKAYMLRTIVESPEAFLNYARNDVKNYHALKGADTFFRKIYDSLNISSYYELPRPTIGATVHNLLKCVLLKYYSLEKSSGAGFLKTAKQGSHEVLTQDLSCTSLYLAKTNGGRCYNNRPTEASFDGPLIDIGIKGCYGKALSVQEYPVGSPIVIGHQIDSENNKYLSLNEFLNTYEHELTYGLWYVRITSKEKLSFDQDFFPSWFPPKNLKDVCNTESTLIEEQGDEYLRNDHTKIYSRELHLSPLQDEGLEWIRTVLSPDQRRELLAKCHVICAIFYPKSQKCADYNAVRVAQKKHKGKNECYAINKRNCYEIVKKMRECHKWCSVNIGELIINKLIKLRASFSKEIDGEREMNTLVKLVINTIYGDIVSPYFPLSNSTVGNNITGRARAMAWYMEKSLNGICTITDGCCFEINNVIKSRHALTLRKMADLKSDRLTPHKARYGNLLRAIKRKHDIESLQRKKEWLEEVIKTHVKDTFPKATVISKYSLEIKEIIYGMASHGASNYITIDANNEISRIKMRSYKDKGYIDYKITPNHIEFSNILSNRIRKWLKGIYDDPNHVPRISTFVDMQLLKTNDFRRSVEASQRNDEGVQPGNSFHCVRVINECTLSTYLFQTHAQYLTWLAEYTRLKRKTLQSYEQRYTLGTYMDYKKMITDIQSKINAGDKRFYSNRKARWEAEELHPYQGEFVRMAEYIRYCESERRVISAYHLDKLTEDDIKNYYLCFIRRHCPNTKPQPQPKQEQEILVIKDS